MYTTYTSHFTPWGDGFAEDHANFTANPNMHVYTERRPPSSIASSKLPTAQHKSLYIASLNIEYDPRRDFTNMFAQKPGGGNFSLKELINMSEMDQKTPPIIVGVGRDARRLCQVPFRHPLPNNPVDELWQPFVTMVNETKRCFSRHIANGLWFSAPDIVDTIMGFVSERWRDKYKRAQGSVVVQTTILNGKPNTWGSQPHGWNQQFMTEEVAPLAIIIVENLKLQLDNIQKTFFLSLCCNITQAIKLFPIADVTLPQFLTPTSLSLPAPMGAYAAKVLEKLSLHQPPVPSMLVDLYTLELVFLVTSLMLATIGLFEIETMLSNVGHQSRISLTLTILALPATLIEAELLILSNLSKNYGKRIIPADTVNRMTHKDQNILQKHHNNVTGPMKNTPKINTRILDKVNLINKSMCLTLPRV